MISTIIAKPTKNCNADCSYCSTPPDNNGDWTFKHFKTIFDRIHPQLHDNATWIWHGGEPMLLGPEFYLETYEYAKSIKPNLRFSMQSNLLMYSSRKWKHVFEKVFNGEISTSFDPDEQNRTIKGSTAVYTKQFYKKIDEVLKDGFRPLVIGTYTEETASYAMKMYEKAKEYGENTFALRFNYRYPAGRVAETGAAIDPVTYGNMLVELYDKWIKELPHFTITPLDQMFKKTFDLSTSSCPWTRACGGKFISIDPNGDVYNCGEFGDLKNPDYRFGNLLEGWIATDQPKQIVNFYKRPKSDESFGPEMMSSHPARLMARRRTNLPMDCKTCVHFNECEGGCMRDAELYERGLGGKFFYCQSWQIVFHRIKSSIISGEADGVIDKMGYPVEEVKARVKANAENSGYMDMYIKSLQEELKEV